MNRKQLYKEALIASLLVIVVDFLLSFVPWKFELIKPIKQGFNDFNVYDLRYAGLDTLAMRKDTSITLLEIAATRSGIAEELSLLARWRPQVVGIDALFKGPSASREDDSALIAAMRRIPHLVLASEIVGTPEKLGKSFMESRLPNATDGFFDFVEGPDAIRRHVQPFRVLDGDSIPSFPVQMLRQISPGAYDHLRERKHGFEMINYQGSLYHYNVVPLSRLLHPEQEEDLAGYFRGKVVFIGYFTPTEPNVLSDMHFTPMNHKRGGKSFPDTYGVVIHANVLEMLWRDEYIHELPAPGVYLMTFVLIFGLNVFYIRRLSRRREHSEFVLFVLQFVLAIALLYLAVLLFDLFNFAFDPMPLLIAVVLSFEIFWLYEWLARQLHKYFAYETFLTASAHPAR